MRLHQANWMNMENAQIFWCKKKQEQQENQIKMCNNVIVVSKRCATKSTTNVRFFVAIISKCEQECTLHMLPFTRWWLILLLCIAFFFQLINDFTFQICTQSTRNQAYCASVSATFFPVYYYCYYYLYHWVAVVFFSARLFENLWQMCTDEWNWNATLKYETLYAGSH